MILRLFRRYVAGWGRPRDDGVVAEDNTGGAIGAAWFLTFPSEGRGFGFVAEDIPEISIAVRRPWRGHGGGTRLLQDSSIGPVAPGFNDVPQC